MDRTWKDIEYRVFENKGIVLCKLWSCRYAAVDRINECAKLSEDDEINYLICEDNITLFANFFMIKLLSDKNEGTIYSLQRLLKKKDIVKVTINFNNGVKQDFELAKRRIAHDSILENTYEETYIDSNDDLCIMVTDKNIRYKKELFAQFFLFDKNIL